jgi:hypothetical protein
MKLLKHEEEYWMTFVTHSALKCEGQCCPVHNPSNHHMRKWPLNYRVDTGITERICKHGVGHPDPDCIIGTEYPVHGCCGCCNPNKKKETKKKETKKKETKKKNAKGK